MDKAKVTLGRPCRRPSSFHPRKTIVDDNFVYQLDQTIGVVKRTPLHWDSREGVGYWELPKPRRALAMPVLPRVVSPKARRAVSVVAVVTLASAVFLLAYPLYPAVQFDLSSRFGWIGYTAASSDHISASNRVYIPKIGVDTAILEGSDLSVLNHAEGVWHQTGLPDSNVVLAGHRWRYLPPNSSTLYNLGHLVTGDTITIDFQGKRYIYRVGQVTTVKQSQVDILAASPTPKLTIYTCSDRWQTKRIVVTAELLP